ncbi:MAG: hypothetical protein GY780_18050, partial [bacterium]|nr:hypothetical protein [bacterium]
MRLHFFILAFVLICTPSYAYEVSFNCGGSSTSADGLSFLADTAYPGSQSAGYVGGSLALANYAASFGGPYQPANLSTRYRKGNFAYQFDVPNGLYAVTLYFSEHKFHGPDLNTFSISINGETQEPDFDIWNRARMFYCFAVRYPAEVFDGLLTVSIGESGQTAYLAGISISDDILGSATTVTDLTATSSYSGINLSWDLPSSRTTEVSLYRALSPAGPFEMIHQRHDLAPFWVDATTVEGVTYYYQASTMNILGQESSVSSIVSATALSVFDSTLPMYSVTIDPDSLSLLRQNPFDDVYYSADLSLDGDYFGPVGVRFRGAVSRFVSNKKSWKIKPDSGWVQGRKKLNLNSDFLDLSLMVPLLSFALFDETACFSPRAQKASFLVNGQYQGLFSEVEQVDDVFMEARGVQQVGNLYKCNSDLRLLSESSYPIFYEKKTNTDYGNEDLVSFVEMLNNTPQSELDDILFPKLNLAGQTDYYANRVFVADYDYFRRNYYLYHQLETDQWEMIPWDLDLSMDIQSVLSVLDLGTEEAPSPNGWNRLFDRLLSVDKYRRYYIDRLTQLVETTYAEDNFNDLADSLAQAMADDVPRDFWKLRFDDNHLITMRLNQIKSFAEQRRAFIESATEPFLSTTNPLFINEVLVRNETTEADEFDQFDSYIEVYNWSHQPVSLNDYCLSNGVVDPQSGILPNEVLAPGGFTIFWADNQSEQGSHHLPFTLDPTQGQVLLYFQNEFSTAVDSLSYTQQFPDVALAVPVDGWWPFELASPSPGLSNSFNSEAAPAFINEFMALNLTTLTDPQGEYEDWVEIYNPLDQPLNLTGYHLSDESLNPGKWEFPPGTEVPAQGFLLVWCDSDPLDAGLHTNFKLSASGESIGLYGPAGAGFPLIDERIFASQVADVSEGRQLDGDPVWITFDSPTPGQSNAHLVAVDPFQNQNFFSLYPASPNPVYGQTTLGFYLGESGNQTANLAVYNLRGQKVRQLLDGTSAPGEHFLSWDRCDDQGRELSAG